MANISQYTPAQYVSSYVPRDFGIIQKFNENKQTRQDAVRQAWSASQSKLGETETYDPELLKQVMDNRQEGFNNLFSSNGGDFSGDGYNSAIDYIIREQDHPFLNNNKMRVAAINEQKKRMSELSQQGKTPYAFEDATQVPLIYNEDGKNYYTDPTKFRNDIVGRPELQPVMAKIWNEFLGENGGDSYGAFDPETGQTKHYTWHGKNIGQIGEPGQKGKDFDAAFGVFKDTDEYKLAKRIAQHEAQKNGSKFDEDAFNKGLAKPFKEIALGLTTMTTGSNVENMPGWNSGSGGGSKGRIIIDEYGKAAVKLPSADMSADDFMNDTPGSPTYGVSRYVNDRVYNDPAGVVQMHVKNLKGFIGGLDAQAAALGIPATTRAAYNDRLSKLQTADRFTNPKEFASALKSYTSILDEANYQKNILPKQNAYNTSQRQEKGADSPFTGNVQSGDPKPFTTKANDLLTKFDMGYRGGVQAYQKKHQSETGITYAANSIYIGDPESAAKTEAFKTRLKNMYSTLNPELLVDEETGKTAKQLRIDMSSIEPVSSQATPTAGTMHTLKSSALGDKSVVSPTIRTFKIIDPDINRFFQAPWDEATDGKFTNVNGDQYKTTADGTVIYDSQGKDVANLSATPFRVVSKETTEADGTKERFYVNRTEGNNQVPLTLGELEVAVEDNFRRLYANNPAAITTSNIKKYKGDVLTSLGLHAPSGILDQRSAVILNNSTHIPDIVKLLKN